MSLKIALQMDPVESININTDSTFVLGLEAQRRGYALFHYHPSTLSLENGRLSALTAPLALRREPGNHYTLGERTRTGLETFDLVLMRQDPPFDMAYITATHLLEHLSGKTLVLNDPAHVRNAPEKLLVTHFPDLMPPTLITLDRAEIDAFRREHGDIIIKPLFGNGGAHIFHLRREDKNLGALLELFAERSREPLMIQKYLPEIRQGDKRIILIDGRPAGAVSRIPHDSESRANFHAGGTAQKAILTRREHDICERIGPELQKRALVFTGIDVIGDYLTEINVTSPTGLQEINRLDGSCLESEFWDAFEKRLK